MSRQKIISFAMFSIKAPFQVSSVWMRLTWNLKVNIHQLTSSTWSLKFNLASIQAQVQIAKAFPPSKTTLPTRLHLLSTLTTTLTCRTRSLPTCSFRITKLQKDCKAIELSLSIFLFSSRSLIMTLSLPITAEVFFKQLKSLPVISSDWTIATLLQFCTWGLTTACLWIRG